MSARDQAVDLDAMRASMSELAAQLSAERAARDAERAAHVAARDAATRRIADLEKERDNLRASHERLREELELWKRRIFIAKAERADNVAQLQLEFADKMRQLDALAGTLGIAHAPIAHR
jgi:chromosome segregation ATPase